MIVPIIAIVEKQYKDYVSACKELKIDPSKTYEKSFVDQLVDSSLENADKKTATKLKWLKKNYEKMEGGALGNKYISRAKKEISKGKLVLDYEIKE